MIGGSLDISGRPQIGPRMFAKCQRIRRGYSEQPNDLR